MNVYLIILLELTATPISVNGIFDIQMHTLYKFPTAVPHTNILQTYPFHNSSNFDEYLLKLM